MRHSPVVRGLILPLCVTAIGLAATRSAADGALPVFTDVRVESVEWLVAVSDAVAVVDVRRGEFRRRNDQLIDVVETIRGPAPAIGSTLDVYTAIEPTSEEAERLAGSVERYLIFYDRDRPGGRRASAHAIRLSPPRQPTTWSMSNAPLQTPADAIAAARAAVAWERDHPTTTRAGAPHADVFVSRTELAGSGTSVLRLPVDDRLLDAADRWLSAADPEAWRNATEALRALGTPPAVERLRGLLRDRRSVERAPNGIPRKVFLVRQWAYVALSGLGVSTDAPAFESPGFVGRLVRHRPWDAAVVAALCAAPAVAMRLRRRGRQQGGARRRHWVGALATVATGPFAATCYVAARLLGDSYSVPYAVLISSPTGLHRQLAWEDGRLTASTLEAIKGYPPETDWYLPVRWAERPDRRTVRRVEATVLGIRTLSAETAEAGNPMTWRIRVVSVPLWYPVIATGLPPLIWWGRALNRHRHDRARLRHGLCLACGYDRQATPADARCPECGTWPTSGAPSDAPSKLGG
ncbi:MAG: hypothetical protein ACAI43_00180 [Phycisphaerae bacterium]